MGDQRTFSGTEPASAGRGHGAAWREAEVLERLWGLRACEHCGETIILGERVFRVQLDGRSEAVCSACAAVPSWGHHPASLHALPNRPVVTAQEREDAA
jgi:hypothetical protein